MSNTARGKLEYESFSKWNPEMKILAMYEQNQGKFLSEVAELWGPKYNVNFPNGECKSVTKIHSPNQRINKTKRLML